MISIRRRTVLSGAAVLAAGGLMPAWARAAQPRVTVFTMDARFADSARAASYWKSRGATVIDARELDLGKAWHGLIPERLAEGSIAGLTLWSDMFICETFARQAGLAPQAAQARLGPELYGWSFS